MLDLEDACAPSEKRAAREAVVDALRSVDFGGMVAPSASTTSRRRGAMATSWTSCGARAEPRRHRAAKVEHASHVWFLDHLLSGLERDLDLRTRSASTSSSRPRPGLGPAAITKAGHRIDALVFGPDDAASLGIAQAGSAPSSVPIPAPVALGHEPVRSVRRCCRASPSTALTGTSATPRLSRAGARGQATRVRGKVVHPSNRGPAGNEVFSPTAQEVETPDGSYEPIRRRCERIAPWRSRAPYDDACASRRDDARSAPKRSSPAGLSARQRLVRVPLAAADRLVTRRLRLT